MRFLERRHDRKAVKRRREGYRTGGTVVMPEIEVPADWTPPPMLPGDDSRETSTAAAPLLRSPEG